jgi:predicted transport protein
MSDIKLFSLQGTEVIELTGSIAALESNLQKQIEANMPGFLGVQFLASEYSTGKTHKGRIDSFGLDENGCPVIIEYKRSKNENVINQGLFYLDWLLDHQAEFKWLVMDVIGGEKGKEQAENIEWAGTRLICIAADFNKYDEHAVQQINRNIELMRYRYFGDALLLLELVNAQSATDQGKSQVSTRRAAQNQSDTETLDLSVTSTKTNGKKTSTDKSQAERLADASPELTALFEELCRFTEQLGDEVQRKDLKLYTAFKRIKNFVSIVIMTGKKDPKLQIYLKLSGALAEDNEFSRDVSGIGHWGTGNFEVNVRTVADLEKAKELIIQSYERS